ncbi:bifunctional lysylphosphatidylglycerol flippase/synthetase MprF [Solicola sp. PLA-1-18]|uniref:bifunctional lysylphosphatidylglycerol flippase/synthetase MprF n=1 Tax=Solicola sp. PLA-1-18 TaxID=3380532 RepID=UPI003B7648ED
MSVTHPVSRSVVDTLPCPPPTAPAPRPDRSGWRRRDRSRLLVSAAVASLGVVGLASALSLPLRDRLHLLLDAVPFYVPTTAAITLAFVSVALIVLARGLRRGQRLAWGATLGLLSASAGLHLARGLDAEWAVVTGVVVVAMLRARRAFPVRSTRAVVRRAATVLTAGTAVLTAAAATLASATGTTDVATALRDSVTSMAGSSVLPVDLTTGVATPVVVALAPAVLAGALWVLTSPAHGARVLRHGHHLDREAARAVVRRHGGGTLDYFALRDDKHWFFDGESVVAYGLRGGICLVSPDPIGPGAERRQVWEAFMSFAEVHGWTVAVLGAAPDRLDLYEDWGMRPVYLGDEAVVDCPTFSVSGHSMRGLRGTRNRLTREGWTVTFHDPADLDPDLRDRLRGLSTQSRRGAVERGFSMTLSRLFDPDDTGLMVSVARDPAGVPQAFVQWTPSADVDGWSLDVMRRSDDPDLPNGVTDLCVLATIDHVAASGRRGLGLNFAIWRTVLAGERPGPLGELGRRALVQASERGQIDSLRRFNDKFHPDWTPRYVVLGRTGALAAQAITIADAEGISELPLVGRFMRGLDR